jgi:hypothetical protein
MTPSERYLYVVIPVVYFLIGFAVAAGCINWRSSPRLSECPSWGVVHVRGAQ